jgi:hypothetical protein
LASSIAAERKALGTEADPVGVLLQAATAELTADAAEDRSAGLALVALSADRIDGSCRTPACHDFDRTATLARAAAWHPEVRPVALAWQVISLKRAFDAFDVARDTPVASASLPDLLDALMGTGGIGLPAGLLLRRAESPQVFLELTRAIGGPEQTSAEDALEVLRMHLVRVCDQALAAPVDPAITEEIRRIRARAGG